MTTDRQADLYRYLLERIDDPVSPSFDEIADALGLQSKSSAKRLIDSLFAQGLVTMVPGKSRTVRAVRRNPFEGIGDEQLFDELRRRGHTIIGPVKLGDVRSPRPLSTH